MQPANPATGHPAGGDHVGPCGDAWLNDFSLPATGSCCNNADLVRQLSDGSYACECPMEITCAALGDGLGAYVLDGNCDQALGALEVPMGAEPGDAGFVVTPGGGGYRDGNPYTPNELVTLALTTTAGGSDLLQDGDVLFEITAGEFAAAGTTNAGVGGSFVDLPAGAQIGCDGKRALLPASVAGKTGLGMMTLPGTGDVTIRVRLSVKPLPTTAAQG